MDYQYITVQREDTTAIVTMNRPDKLNALSPELLDELSQAFRDIARDDSVHATVITGGEKVFAAGADLARMVDQTPVTIHRRYLDLRTTSGVWDTIETMPQPVIAAIAGYALGGGCELAMCCDLRIAADTAVFGQPEIRVGVIPGAGGTQRLARLIGMTKAKELVLLGEHINAEEAYRIGLVNKVVPLDQLMAEAKAIAKKFANLPPFTVRMAKMAMNVGYDLPLPAGLAVERLAYNAIYATEDQKEGMRAFLEKRRPQYKGR